MDICNADWGAIATFTTGGIALYISHKWYEQKKIEVLAIEARQLVDNLVELESTLAKFIYAENGKIRILYEDMFNVIKYIESIERRLKFLNLNDDDFNKYSTDVKNRLQSKTKSEKGELTIYIDIQVTDSYKQLKNSLNNLYSNSKKIATFDRLFINSLSKI